MSFCKTVPIVRPHDGEGILFVLFCTSVQKETETEFVLTRHSS